MHAHRRITAARSHKNAAHARGPRIYPHTLHVQHALYEQKHTKALCCTHTYACLHIRADTSVPRHMCTCTRPQKFAPTLVDTRTFADNFDTRTFADNFEFCTHTHTFLRTHAHITAYALTYLRFICFYVPTYTQHSHLHLRTHAHTYFHLRTRIYAQVPVSRHR